MKPYSQDLRDCIIHALEAGDASQPAIATRFWVSLSFVEKLWQRFRRSGSSAAKPHAGEKPRALKEHTALRRHEVAQQPDATLEFLSDFCRARARESINIHISLKALLS